MPLIIGVKANDRIYLANHVLEVRLATRALVRGAIDGRVVEITREAVTHLAPSVFVRQSASRNPYPRLDFDAPKSVKISLYRRDRSLNLQKQLIMLCEMAAADHERPLRVLQRLLALSPRVRQAMQAILADPQSPKFGVDWSSRFARLVTSAKPVSGGLPGLGSRR